MSDIASAFSASIPDGSTEHAHAERRKDAQPTAKLLEDAYRGKTRIIAEADAIEAATRHERALALLIAGRFAECVEALNEQDAAEASKTRVDVARAVLLRQAEQCVADPEAAAECMKFGGVWRATEK